MVKVQVKIRGKELDYWNKQIFHLLFQLTPKFNLIFNPGKFLHIGQEAIKGIVEFLNMQKPEEDHVFTLPGDSIFILSAKTLEKLSLSDSHDDAGFNALLPVLKKESQTHEIPLNCAFQVIGYPMDIRHVESSILDYQINYLLSRGVHVEDHGNFYLEGLLPIGSGTSIATGTVIKGNSGIGENVKVYPNAYIENSWVGDNCVILPGCILRDSRLEEDVQIGPYTHLRNNALVKKGAKMGNFVEMKKSVLGEGSKAMHLTYLGDAEIGKKVNIGAGTITCNYDGKNKNKSIIEDNVFIGSGTELIAPIKINKNSYVAAGSTITEDVPQDSLGVARQKQRNIEGWVKRKRG